MIRNLKNVTSSTIILDDFYGKSVEPGETFDGLQFGDFDLRMSVSIAHGLIHGTLELSDGVNTFKGLQALDVVRGSSGQVTKDGKQIITASDRPINTLRCYSSSGDNLQTGKIWGGNELNFSVPPGQTVTKDIQYAENLFIKDGQIMYHNVEDICFFDFYVVCPAGVPFEAPSNNGNYDYTDNTWTPNSNNTGKYFILGTETILFHFIKNFPLVKDCHLGQISSPEPQYLPTPYILRFDVKNNNTTADLRACILISMYRYHTYN